MKYKQEKNYEQIKEPAGIRNSSTQSRGSTAKEKLRYQTNKNIRFFSGYSRAVKKYSSTNKLNPNQTQKNSSFKSFKQFNDTAAILKMSNESSVLKDRPFSSHNLKKNTGPFRGLVGEKFKSQYGSHKYNETQSIGGLNKVLLSQNIHNLNLNINLHSKKGNEPDINQFESEKQSQLEAAMEIGDEM